MNDLETNSREVFKLDLLEKVANEVASELEDVEDFFQKEQVNYLKKKA